MTQRPSNRRGYALIMVTVFVVLFGAMLDQAGVKYVYYQSPGTAHEWLTWRRDLNDFAPRLFRDDSK